MQPQGSWPPCPLDKIDMKAAECRHLLLSCATTAMSQPVVKLLLKGGATYTHVSCWLGLQLLAFTAG